MTKYKNSIELNKTVKSINQTMHLFIYQSIVTDWKMANSETFFQQQGAD